MKEKTNIIAFRMKVSDKAKLKEICERAGSHYTVIVRRLVLDFIENADENTVSSMAILNKCISDLQETMISSNAAHTKEATGKKLRG